jgi:hypothetical protein
VAGSIQLDSVSIAEPVGNASDSPGCISGKEEAIPIWVVLFGKAILTVISERSEATVWIYYLVEVAELANHNQRKPTIPL